MSVCLEEGDEELAERANWMIEVEKLRKEKRLVQVEEKTDLVSIRYSVKHCFSSGDGSEEREREREVGGNSN